MKYSTIFRRLFDAASVSYVQQDDGRAYRKEYNVLRDEAQNLYVYVTRTDTVVDCVMLLRGPEIAYTGKLFGGIVAAGIVYLPSNQRLQAYAGVPLGSIQEGTIRYSHEFLEGVPGASPKTIRPFSPGLPTDLCPGLRYLLLAELGDDEHKEWVAELARRPYSHNVSSSFYNSWPSDSHVWQQLLEIQMA
jgi:hypothetical protein